MILRWKYEKYQIARLQHNPVTVSAGSSRVRFWYIFQGAGKKYLEKNIRYLVVGGQDVIRRLVSVVGWYWRGNRTRVSGWDPTYFDSPSCGPAVRYVQGTVRPGRAGLRQWGEERQETTSSRSHDVWGKQHPALNKKDIQIFYKNQLSWLSSQCLILWTFIPTLWYLSVQQSLSPSFLYEVRQMTTHQPKIKLS